MATLVIFLLAAECHQTNPAMRFQNVVFSLEKKEETAVLQITFKAFNIVSGMKLSGSQTLSIVHFIFIPCVGLHNI